jgi:hypothetical protein
MTATAKKFDRMAAAYRLRLAEQARRLGAEWAATWGEQGAILADAETRHLVPNEDEYRLPPYPFPGLRAFDQEEAKLFFGRERSVVEVQERLADSGVVVVLGGSGSGKSSLVRAGLLPHLNAGRPIQGRIGSWYKAAFRPRTDPLGELADALADQVQLPLLAAEAPGLETELTLPEGVTSEDARAELEAKMRERLAAARRKGRDAICETLLRFVDEELDHYDDIVSGGIRVQGPSLMLVVDQFEEVFRPEIAQSERAALLDLVVDLATRLGHRDDHGARSYRGGLFLVVTMRSEELHRCAEHRGLSEVINNSLYLLELLDPDNEEDAQDLHKAIVEPARQVLDDWGLLDGVDHPDAPFEAGMPGWLLKGAGRNLPHQPDRLPLLQHALNATWHAAMRRWSSEGFGEPRLVIQKADLPGQGTTLPHIPDLGNCLCRRADKAAERARQRFKKRLGASIDDGERILEAAFRSLARRDDRGNWARRFAAMKDIMAYVGADQSSALAKVPDAAVRDVLNEMVVRSFLNGGDGAPYDISHEALIRNWPRFQEWLREPESAALALERVVSDVDPRLPEVQQLVEWIPPGISDRLALVLGPGPTLPEALALEQLETLLGRSSINERWQGKGAQEVLANIKQFRNIADDERARVEADRRKAEERARIAEEDRKHQDEIQHYKDEKNKLQKRYLAWLVVLVIVSALAVGSAIWDNAQRTKAALHDATAETLIGTALSDQGSQLPPDLRAQVILRAKSFIEAAAEVPRFPDDSAESIGKALARIGFLRNDPDHQVPPIAKMQKRATLALVRATRESLGRNLAILDKDIRTAAFATPVKCTTEADNSWVDLPGPPGAESVPKSYAFKIDAHGRLQFGVNEKVGGQPLAAYLDLQASSLGSGARVCLSSDARILTISNLNNNYPELFELQWASCRASADCGRDGRNEFSWRVRSIPIPTAYGPNTPQTGSYPCVTATTNLALDKDEPAAPSDLGRVQVQFTTDVGPAKCSDHMKPLERDVQAPTKYVAEFYAGLAAPRSVAKPNLAFTPCVQPTDLGATTCSPNPASPVVEIVRRSGDTPVILEVSVEGDEDEQFIAQKVSLPANKIVASALTPDGELLLQDDTDLTWKFVITRKNLESRLWTRGCGGREHSPEQRTYPANLADFGIDLACAEKVK